MIDNLRIFDQLANDLVLNGFTGPESVIGAKPADYSVKIYNDGTNEATDYKVCIYSGDKLIAEQNGKPIRSDAYETFDFVLSSPVNSTVFDLTAKIEFDGDLDTDNNSAALSVAVERPKYPTIDNLSAEDNDNSVSLTWSRPALSCIPDPATDDIESYEEWSIGGIDDSNRTGTIGDYTVYDNDGQTTAKINAWAPQYPNSEAENGIPSHEYELRISVTTIDFLWPHRSLGQTIVRLLEYYGRSCQRRLPDITRA